MSKVGSLYNVENNQQEEILQRSITSIVYDNQRQQYLNTTLNGIDNRINAVDAKTIIATTQQAQQGVNDTSLMTPLKTAQAISQGGTFRGNVKIENAAPVLEFSETDQVGRYFFATDLGRFSLRKDSLDNQNYPFLVEADGRVIVNGVNIQELFQSVSNGKSQVAAAITGKGIQTAADATFATMATNINSISTGPQTQTGTVLCSNDTLPFNNSAGTTTNLRYVTVTGLNFMPRRIVIRYVNGLTRFITTYDSLAESGYCTALNFTSNTTDYSSSLINIGNNSYITSAGFRLPVRIEEQQSFTWFAES